MKTIEIIACENGPLFAEITDPYTLRRSYGSELDYETSGRFEQMLLEAVCGLPYANREKEQVQVVFEATLREVQRTHLRTVFDFYARAEGVIVTFTER